MQLINSASKKKNKRQKNSTWTRRKGLKTPHTETENWKLEAQRTDVASCRHYSKNAVKITQCHFCELAFKNQLVTPHRTEHHTVVFCQFKDKAAELKSPKSASKYRKSKWHTFTCVNIHWTLLGVWIPSARILFLFSFLFILFWIVSRLLNIPPLYFSSFLRFSSGSKS